MDITRYLGQPKGFIGSTVAVYVCPCCNKDLKVNIAIKTKPYKCWSGGCTPDQIRAKLKLTVLPKSEIISQPAYNIQPIHLSSIDPLFISDYVPPIAVRRNIIHDGKAAVSTTYRYSSTHQVQRIDFLDGSKKKFLPSYIFEGNRKYGADYNCPLFNEEFIKDEGKTIYMVEGEKCAVTMTQALGLLAVSPPGFGWNEKYLRPRLQILSKKISGIVILPDNDKAGITKADLLRTVAWTVGIPTKLVKFPEAQDSEDIADLIYRNVNVLPYLK
jgi:hypothetical protein